MIFSLTLNGCITGKQQVQRIRHVRFFKFLLSLNSKRDLNTKKTTPNIEVWPESLGVMLEYWYIERGFFSRRELTSQRILKQHYLSLTSFEEIRTQTTQEFFKRADLIIPPKILPKTLVTPWTPCEIFCNNSQLGSINLGHYKFTTALVHYFMGLSVVQSWYSVTQHFTLVSLSESVTLRDRRR